MKRARKSGISINRKKETKSLKSVVNQTANTQQLSVMEQKKAKLKEKIKKAQQRKKYTAIFAISLCVIIIASLITLGIGGLFDTIIDNSVLEEIEPVDTVSGKVNVLILGVDKEGLRTDTIIVASYDANNGVVNMLSIPRDTRMYIGSKYQKINSAHAISQSNGKIKGPNGTIDAVTRLTGIPINYYVEFSFEAFRDTIDALDGVYFDVPQSMKYRDPTQGLNINLSKGYQLLDGDKAEQLVRFRQYPEGDIKRVEVQQNFIKAVAEQKLNAQIVTKIPDLYKVLSKNVKTNFKLSDIVKYANSLLNIDLNNIVMHELPGEYSGSEYQASYWLPDMKEVKLLVQNTFGYDTEYATCGKPIAGAVYGKTTTEILNPEDVVIREQDKHKTPTVSTQTSTSDKTTESDEDEDEDKDDEENETTSKPNNDKTSTSNKTDDSSSAKDDNKKNESQKDTQTSLDEQEISRPASNPDTSEEKEEEPKTPSVPETPVVEPIESINSSKDFVRPGAN